MKEKSKIRAVIDTNVIVSSLFSKDGNSNPARIIKYIFDGLIIPIFNDEIISEYVEVLSRKSFSFKPYDIRNLISAFMEYGLVTERSPVFNEIFPDPDDIVFYEVMKSHEDTYLITGNIKHFPQSPFIVTPTQMIEIINETRIGHGEN